MSETDGESKRWLEGLAPQIQAATGMAELLALIQRIDERYRGNFARARDEQLPFAVFERLIEKVQAIVEAAASPATYAALRAVPDEVLGKTQLVEAVRGRLLEVLEARDEDDAPVLRAQLRFDAGDVDGAGEDYAAILARDPSQRAARRGEVQVLLAQQRGPEAMAALDELLRRAPDDEVGLFERSRLAMRYHHVSEAIADVERLIRVTSQVEPRVFAARQLVYVGRPGDAVAALRDITDSVEALVVRGKALLDLGELEAASAALEAALGLTRGHETQQRFASAKVSALKLLGDALARRGDPARALDRYIEAMDLVGTTYELRRAVVQLAWTGLGAPVDGEPGWIEANMTARFEAGRPVEVSTDDLSLAPYLERLPWVTTVEHLVIGAGRRDNRDALAVLFQLALPRLRRFEIEAEHFGFACLYRLVAAPWFAQLEALTLRQCDLDAPALQLLLERIPPGLRELRIYTAGARPLLPRARTLADVLRDLRAPNLRTLELSDCALVPDEVDALVAADLPQLEVLGLTGNDLRALDVAHVLDSTLVRQLRELSVSDTANEPAIVRGVLDRREHLALRVLRAYRDWSDDERRAILQHPAYALFGIELGVSAISDDAWLSLLD